MTQRLRWSGNVQAQSEADAAYSKLTSKYHKKKRRKERTFNHCAPDDELSREFRAIIG